MVEADPGPQPLRPHPGADLLVALLVLAAAATTVAFLWPLTPAPEGHGTHEQLGLGRCSWPELYGKPCPTCGVTTAACLMLHLRPLAAIRTQPFGAAVALLGLVAAGFALARIVAGRPFLPVLARWFTARALLVLVALFLLAWGYKALTW